MENIDLPRRSGILTSRYSRLKDRKRLPNTQAMRFGPSAAEIWREVDNAAQLSEELGARGCELHFDLDAQGALAVTLRDLDGRILREIGAGEAVEIASTPPGPELDRLLRS
jgi:hypothetical protein